MRILRAVAGDDGVWRLPTRTQVTQGQAVVVITAGDNPQLLVATVPFGANQPAVFSRAGELRNVRPPTCEFSAGCQLG